MEHTLKYKNSPKYITYKNRHKIKFNNKNYINEEEFNTISSKNCFYCGTSGPNGIDRYENDIGYQLNNCVPCCKHCNYVKGNLSIKLFNIWKDRFVKYQNKNSGQIA